MFEMFLAAIGAKMLKLISEKIGSIRESFRVFPPAVRAEVLFIHFVRTGQYTQMYDGRLTRVGQEQVQSAAAAIGERTNGAATVVFGGLPYATYEESAELIAATLDADFFFAHPYSSWERGANENMNGLIRQFFPKKMAFELITTKDVELVIHQLNHRPRKCLGYRTPHEVFMEQLQLHNPSVALQT